MGLNPSQGGKNRGRGVKMWRLGKIGKIETFKNLQKLYRNLRNKGEFLQIFKKKCNKTQFCGHLAMKANGFRVTISALFSLDFLQQLGV